MSSVERVTAQIPANKLYISIANGLQSTIFDTNLSTVAWVNSVTALSTPGAAVLRDMGKTVYLPAVGGASQSTILRKIQLVPSGVLGSYGTGGTSGTAGTEFYTGYISLGGQTYGGGSGIAAPVARLN